MYYLGQGVKRNYKKAAELFQKSSKQGNIEAQYNLGNMYVYGRGVKQDRIKAYQYWMKAAKMGHINAQRNLDVLCRQSPWICK